MVNMPTVV